MTTSLDVLNMIHDALIAPGATDADGRVMRPGDLPTQIGQYPNHKVRVIAEARRQLARGGPAEFETTVTIRIVSEVSAPAEVGNVTLSSAEAELWALKRQVEVAIINSYPLFAAIQQLVSVQTQLAFTANATHLAGIQSDYALEFYEGPESFAPVAAVDLDDVRLGATHHPPAGFTADLQH